MTENSKNREIADKPYWERYYKNKSTNSDQIKSICRVYDKYWAICIEEQTRSVIEIGAYPGRYISYVAQKYNLHPTGLDFQSDLSLIEKSFQVMGIENYELINQDFLSWSPKTKYDLVLSIGFIEHFENYEEVISKHFQLLDSGGKVFFHVPNKRYIRKLYGQLVDRENLKAHNLKVMSFDVFRKAAAQNNMEIEVLEYFGPFQYGLHGDDPNIFKKLVFNGFRVLFKKLKLNNLVEKYPSKFWSACIICIMRKE